MHTAFQAAPILEGFKEKIEAVFVDDDRLYLGSANGSLHVYKLCTSEDGSTFRSELVEVKKDFSRRAVEHLSVIPEIKSLVSLSDGYVSLHDIHTLKLQSQLAQTKGALSFAVDTSVQTYLADGTYKVERPTSQVFSDIDAKARQEKDMQSTSTAEEASGPALVTALAVGCRKKAVLFRWRDGEFEDVKEIVLAHSPRSLAFPSSHSLFVGFNPSDYAIITFSSSKGGGTRARAPTLSPDQEGGYQVSEISVPSIASGSVLPAAGSLGALSGLGGLGGYMTLGIRKAAKPVVVKVDGEEVLVGKDNMGVFLGPDGKPARREGLNWPAIPEEVAFARPYVFAVLPAGVSVGDEPVQKDSNPLPLLQIRSSSTLVAVQTIPFPPTTSEPGDTAPTSPPLVRLITPSPSSKPPVYVTVTPTDRSRTEGTTVWRLEMKSWGQQIDELVEKGEFEEALSLLDTVDKVVLEDKDERRRSVLALHAVSLFSLKKFDDAIDIFIELNINPAKVISLFPEEISGPLATDRDDWFEAFGRRGRRPPKSELNTADEPADASQRTDEDFRRSVDTLTRFLTDRRRIYAPILEIHPSAPSSSTSATRKRSPRDLLDIPSQPLETLDAERLFDLAMCADTALFKAYVAIKPALLGPLCRLINWCDVQQVEEILMAKKKHQELLDLYHGKNMHNEALRLLRRLSDDEPEPEDKVEPTVRYLQKLGAGYLSLIFETSSWVFETYKPAGLEIFTADLEEVESWPRRDVAQFLEQSDRGLAIGFLEHVIHTLGDASPDFHEKLVLLYLQEVQELQRGSGSLAATAEQIYSRLLRFLDSSDQYRADRLLARVPQEDMFEVRAHLLGRLGQHEAALQIYVHRLQDYQLAEEYCKKAYKEDMPESSNPFFLLLRIYLRPRSGSPSLLAPALHLVTKHGSRMPAINTLDMLPEMATLREVDKFLDKMIRDTTAKRRDARVLKEVVRARSDQVERTLMALHQRRVKVTESRTCPRCHKRLGNSVIAVTAEGEVQHFYCSIASSSGERPVARIADGSWL